MMKNVLLIVVAILFVTAASAQENRIKVACIGNSITYGYGLPDRTTQSYPAQLQKMLGESYQVENFGKSGATLLNKGHRPYMQQDEYRRAIDFGGDIVVIHLGINDTDPRDWPDYRDSFVKDYIELIDSFRAANSKVRIMIARLTPIADRHPRFLSGTRDWHGEIQLAIENVARYTGVQLIDFHEPLYPYPFILTDAVHPDSEGAFIMAQTVYSAITGDYGGLKMSLLYTDNMVLQRDVPLTVQGIANAGDRVTVSIADRQMKTKAGLNGKWSVTLPPLKAGGPYTLKISTDETDLQYQNVLAGEVWLCSGQSNMEYCFKWRVDDITDRSTLFDNKKIRFFKVAKSSSAYPVERIQGKWEICSPEIAEDFSVVAFCFGKRLNEELGNLPIGLIGSYWGGTAIEPWMDEFTLRHEKLEEKTKALTAGWAPTANSSLYNAMIHPIINYTIAGVVWYQGEANNERHQDYGVMFDAMIRGWRNAFHHYLPFYFVQITPWSGYADKNAAYLREQQADVAATLRNTGMVVAGDLVNDLTDIHPSLKRQVGERLANMALKNSYHKEDIQPYSPMLKSFRVDGRKVIVTTTAIGKLACKDKVIRHFEVVDKEGNLHPAKASILKNGDISVIADKVKEPVGVRYCFSNDAMPNLFDSNGLPLAPFRTDRKK